MAPLMSADTRARPARALLLRGLAVVALTLLLMKLFGSLRFAPWATGWLIDAAALFGLHGVEAVENFYMLATILLSLLIALALVGGVTRWRDGARRQPPLNA
jgi:hypothetical protein